MPRILPFVRRAIVAFQPVLVLTVCLLLGTTVLLLPAPASRAAVPADLPTASPVPPTEVPATQMPAVETPVPPTEVPPTEVPAIEAPPTEVPERATEVPPTPTSKPRRTTTDRDEEPTPTPLPPTATPVPPAAPPRIDISTRKMVSAPAARRGETVVYTVEVSNAGEGHAADVVMNDRVPAALEVIDLGSSKGDIVVDGQGQVMAFPATLDPGESAVYRITVRVRADAPAGVVVNRADSTTSTPGDNPQNNTSQVELLIEVPPPPAAPPAAAPPVRPPSLPPTSDPNEVDGVWRLLPWALLAVAVVGVGGMLAWSVVGVQNLSTQVAALLGQRTSAPIPMQAPPPPAPPQRHPQPTHDRSLPPVGPRFAPPPPVRPLPPLVALDRESVLRPKGREETF